MFLQLQYTEYWWATSISISDGTIRLPDQTINRTSFFFIIYFQKVCAFYSKAHEESGAKIEAKQSADKSSFLLFFFFQLPYQTWKADNHCHPATPPFSCPSHLCVCTAAISKSISCHFSFLLVQFCSLHLPQGDKLLPHGLGLDNLGLPLCRISSLMRLWKTPSIARTMPTCWR